MGRARLKELTGGEPIVQVATVQRQVQWRAGRYGLVCSCVAALSSGMQRCHACVFLGPAIPSCAMVRYAMRRNVQMWTLVLLIFVNLNNAGAAPAAVSIAGFSTRDICVTAGTNLSGTDFSGNGANARFTCVQMSTGDLENTKTPVPTPSSKTPAPPAKGK